jgi:multidrug efflux pump subunit AcrB
VSDPGSPYIPKNLFIRRPILSSVISIVIVLLGLFSMKGLPLPATDDHAAQRERVGVLPGATASDVAEAVAAPIEQQLSGIQTPFNTHRPMPATAR